jgi:Holliday junction DNA helicase RuvA
MIGQLRGQILAKHPPLLILDVNGIGYELEAPMSTFYDLPAVGGTVTLITHLVVREDAHSLYGFARQRDRDLFRALLRVSGVGARIGLAILSGMDAARFIQCVEQEDISALTRVPGIGTKTAQRLVVELRDRLDTIGAGFATTIGTPTAGTSSPTGVPGSAPGALADAISALVALGYKPADANRMARAADDGAKSSEEIIRTALRAINIH